jgi:mono/diheme cytochrome c family protein
VNKLIGLIVVLVVLVGGGLAFVYSGIYDVAAAKPHTGIMHWMLSTVSDRSIERHSGGIQAPDLTGPDRIREGMEHYHAMCEICHGGPGLERTETARGLNPHAPNLAESAKEMSPAELFWVTKNGIKMTGMPAFGVTHSDDKIWSIVAFLETLPGMSGADYRSRVADLPKGEDDD